MPRKRKKQQPGICGNNGCHKPIKPPHFYYCEFHYQRAKESQNRVRAFRVRMGFCCFCLTRAREGISLCERHAALSIRNSGRYNAKVKKARGWKLVRVKL